MKKLYSTLSFLCFLHIGFSQTLGKYQFTDTAVCPVANNFVNSQPANASFTSFEANGLTCVPTANVFNNSGWNPLTTIDLTKYYEFTLISDLNFALNLDSLIFTSRISSNTATWYLRSSIDNFSSDIATGNSTNILDTVSILLPANHQNVIDASFRFYVSSVTDEQRAWRIDDVTLIGEVVAETNSLAENFLSNIEIFPNPGNDFISIVDKHDHSIYKVSILSSDGKIMIETTNEKPIEVQSLEKGIYFIKISSSDNQQTITWIKK